MTEERLGFHPASAYNYSGEREVCKVALVSSGADWTYPPFLRDEWHGKKSQFCLFRSGFFAHCRRGGVFERLRPWGVGSGHGVAAGGAYCWAGPGVEVGTVKDF